MSQISFDNKLVSPKNILVLLNRFLAVMGPDYVEHCVRTSYLTLRLAQKQGLDDATTRDLTLSAFFHDIGAIGKTNEYLLSPDYDAFHSVDGYLLLRYKSPLKEAAKIVLFHHCSYSHPVDDPYFALGLKIAVCDRFDDWIRNHIDLDVVVGRIKGQAGIAFDPQDVKDLLEITSSQEVLDDLENDTFREYLTNYVEKKWSRLTSANDFLLLLSSLFELYDHTTYNHSKTVATVAYYIGKKLGYTQEDCYDLYFSGIVHDLGKIFIPLSILDKPAKLTAEEYAVMKKHIVYSRELIHDLLPQEIVDIACNHHERLDGSGYPAGLTHEQMNEPQELMQVADVLSALLAKRSYKDEYPYELVRSILLDSAAHNKLSQHIVDAVIDNHEEILAVANATIKAGYEEAERLQSKRGPLIAFIKTIRSHFAGMPLSNFARL